MIVELVNNTITDREKELREKNQALKARIAKLEREQKIESLSTPSNSPKSEKNFANLLGKDKKKGAGGAERNTDEEIRELQRQL